jgi:hypothetical protein
MYGPWKKLTAPSHGGTQSGVFRTKRKSHRLASHGRLHGEALPGKSAFTAQPDRALRRRKIRRPRFYDPLRFATLRGSKYPVMNTCTKRGEGPPPGKL